MSEVYKKLLTASSSETDEFFNNVSLLLHGDGTDGAQNNTFLDGSTNNFTIARNGNTTQGSFSPYFPTGPYNPSTHGGSAYFDGTDSLTFTGATSGAGDFTTEAWVNLSALLNYNVVLDNRASGASTTGYAFGVTGTGAPYMYTSNAFRIVSSITITANAWNHLALVRSGTTVTLYVNGVSGGTYTSSANFSDTNNSIGVTPTFGYISDLRVIKGTAIYTSSFTPPTEPLTAVANTSLLCNFTNAAIFDSAAKNVLETVGNAQIDTAVTKFGTGSIYFDGTGDSLSVPSNVENGIGTSDFTVEAWIYPTATHGNRHITDSTSTGGLFLKTEATTVGIGKSNIGIDNMFSFTFSPNQWYHVAFCRQGSTVYGFVDGVQIGSGANTVNYTSPTGLTIGNAASLPAGWIGYIDDLRVTNGVARYTTNFTPRSRAFPDQ